MTTVALKGSYDLNFHCADAVTPSLYAMQLAKAVVNANNHRLHSKFRMGREVIL